MSSERRGSYEELDSLLWMVLRLICAICGIVGLAYNMAFMGDDPAELRGLLALICASALGPVITASLAELIRAVRGGGDERQTKK